MEEATLVISARFGKGLAGTSEMGVRQMHLKQYRVVSLRFAAVLLMWPMEPTLEKVASALK
jgi:hypothetical protein